MLPLGMEHKMYALRCAQGTPFHAELPGPGGDRARLATGQRTFSTTHRAVVYQGAMHMPWGRSTWRLSAMAEYCYPASSKGDNHGGAASFFMSSAPAFGHDHSVRCCVFVRLAPFARARGPSVPNIVRLH